MPDARERRNRKNKRDWRNREKKIAKWGGAELKSGQSSAWQSNDMNKVTEEKRKRGVVERKIKTQKVF